MYVLAVSRIFTFATSTKRNHNILSVVIKVFVPASFVPLPNLLQ